MGCVQVRFGRRRPFPFLFFLLPFSFPIESGLQHGDRGLAPGSIDVGVAARGGQLAVPKNLLDCETIWALRVKEGGAGVARRPL